MTSKTTVETIKDAAAKAFFACAWADRIEESGGSVRGEIMDQMPSDIDPAALAAADTLVAKFIDGFDFTEPGLSATQKVAAIYMSVSRLRDINNDDQGDVELTPANFGHYLAMQAMGHGVGIERFGHAVRDGIPVPSVEFSGCSLERDYT